MYDPTKDPSLSNIIDDVAVVRYLRSELGFESDLPYQGPFGGGYPPPTSFRGDWMSVRWNRGPGAGARAARQPPAQAAAPEPEQPLRPRDVDQPVAEGAEHRAGTTTSCAATSPTRSSPASLEPEIQLTRDRPELWRRPRDLHG